MDGDLAAARSDFTVPAESYDRFMGRYSRRLAPLFADVAGARPGAWVLDVGCGPGALTALLAARCGADRVAAVEPSAPFAAACAARVPGADVRHAAAEDLPWPADRFDLVLSQLVLPFVVDQPLAVAEMRRVAVAGGVVAACCWDHSDGMEMLRVFWDAALALDPAAPAEVVRMRYGTPAELCGLWAAAGLGDITTGEITVVEEYADLDDWWEPFTTGVGPAGAWCAALPPADRAALRAECDRRLGHPTGAFPLRARALTVRGVVPAG